MILQNLINKYIINDKGVQKKKTMIFNNDKIIFYFNQISIITKNKFTNIYIYIKFFSCICIYFRSIMM